METESTPKYINLLTDYGFKKVFGDEYVMAAFLNDFLQPSSKICKVTFIDKEMKSSNIYERGVVYDLRCKLEDGTEIIVEMQKGKQEYFSDRILYYLARSVASQGYKGKKPDPVDVDKKVNWNFCLEPVYGIFFMDFTISNLEPNRLRKVALTVNGTAELFNEKVKAFTIELPGFKDNKLSDCEEKLDYWTYIINNMARMNTKPNIPDMPILGRILELASTAAMTPEEYSVYEDSVDAYNTTMASFEYYKKEGMIAGMKAGMEEGMKAGMEEGMKAGMEEGMKAGMEEGMKAGMEEGQKKGQMEERAKNVLALKASGFLTDQQIADVLHIDIQQVMSL